MSPSCRALVICSVRRGSFLSASFILFSFAIFLRSTIFSVIWFALVCMCCRFPFHLRGLLRFLRRGNWAPRHFQTQSSSLFCMMSASPLMSPKGWLSACFTSRLVIVGVASSYRFFAVFLIRMVSILPCIGPPPTTTKDHLRGTI